MNVCYPSSCCFKRNRYREPVMSTPSFLVESGVLMWFFSFHQHYIPILRVHGREERFPTFPHAVSVETLLCGPHDVYLHLSIQSADIMWLVFLYTYVRNQCKIIRIYNQSSRYIYIYIYEEKPLYHGTYDVYPLTFLSKVVISCNLSLLHYTYIPVLGHHAWGERLQTLNRDVERENLFHGPCYIYPLDFHQ
jgi:hypothetical protein